MGNSHPSLFPYEPLPTADGEIIVIAGNDRQFRKLAAALGIAEVADDPRFATVPQRNVNREQLRPLLIACLETKSAQKWFDVLSAAGIPCGPINDVRGGIELATELGLEPVALAGDVPTVRHPLRFSQTPPRYDLPPPALDEHGEEIRAWLGQPAAHLRTLGAADSAPVPSA
jgi:crotonobetainyl-CoA:carnitine CoA-transferase CaiB-like acyl-CoA transferase